MGETRWRGPPRLAGAHQGPSDASGGAGGINTQTSLSHFLPTSCRGSLWAQSRAQDRMPAASGPGSFWGTEQGREGHRVDLSALARMSYTLFD